MMYDGKLVRGGKGVEILVVNQSVVSNKVYFSTNG